ncbi:MAG: curli production assembly protein CsgG [Bradyrhizobiaceae bacterium]|nr:curli production assembly protein CsgG [Bradyrhizobiaceae bacterium]
MRRSKPAYLAALLSCLFLAGCQTMAGSVEDPVAEEPTLIAPTKTSLALQLLPPPARRLDVAVYDFPDVTGQHKSSHGQNYAEFSRAVTQGGAEILMDVLREAGTGTWFDVIERKRLPGLLQERKIIESTRAAAGKRAAMPPLRFAGVLLEGGIIGYDFNETTGGAGARYLGIGGSVQHRRDVVTIALRAVSVSSGRVLASITTTKTIYSVLVQGMTFKFVGVDELLEIDAGFSKNHPRHLAVREAIQLAVYALVLEGVKLGLWGFADPEAGQELIDRYEKKFGSQRVSGYAN